MSAQLPVTSEPTCRELNQWVFNMIRKSWPEVTEEERAAIARERFVHERSRCGLSCSDRTCGDVENCELCGGKKRERPYDDSCEPGIADE